MFIDREKRRDILFNIVLLEPEIPFNTGAIGRTCVATDTKLHLIKPLGFSLDDKMVKRSGLDYWDKLKLFVYENIEDFYEKNPNAKYFILQPQRPKKLTMR